MKVLILEDEQMMARLLSTLLNLEGFDVEVYEDFSGLTSKMILSSGADILFMDVNLKQKSSIPLLKEIRKRKKGQNLRIIMTSGMNLKKECLETGANHFLLKPFMPDELITILKTYKDQKFL